MKDKQLEWTKQEELLKQAVRVEGNYGDYSILRLSNGLHVVLDRSNFKFLLPLSGPLYDLSVDWDLWVKRGFIVVIFPELHRDFRYYIFSIRNKECIIKGKEVKANAFLEGRSDYFMVINNYFKDAIFDKNGRQITDWYGLIYQNGLIKGESVYYVARKDGKEAIFDRDGNQVSGWYNYIETDGLVKGESDYYRAVENWKYAIFHKDGQQITDWFNYISKEGLVSGKSDYYIAKKGNKHAIFHKNGNQVSGWHSYIYADGLVFGQSDYYIAEENGKKAIFRKNGNQISDWFEWISETGLVSGQTKYYIGKRNTLYYICKLGSSKMLGPLKSVNCYGLIKYPSQNVTRVVTSDDKYLALTKQEVDDYFKENEVENER
jgi:hypothetical protein